ncbi:hypothetical protein N7448_007352 [Penicillium atrosanguineum]|nr:hypothetical protein N7448_007352 [Penicillium atrosanguineum]
MSFINHNPPDQGIALLSPKHEGINEKATPTVLAALGEPKVSEESLGESDRAIMTIVTGAVFLTQIYDTVLGGFISYTIMISIVTRNKALLVNGNGDASWGGANIQAYDTNATSWALDSYLYKIGAQYQMVPIGMAIGAAAVVVQTRIFKEYSFLIAAAFDGGSLMILVILSFVVFGAGGISHPFPSWWENNVKGNYDWCPAT